MSNRSLELKTIHCLSGSSELNIELTSGKRSYRKVLGKSHLAARRLQTQTTGLRAKGDFTLLCHCNLQLPGNDIVTCESATRSISNGTMLSSCGYKGFVQLYSLFLNFSYPILTVKRKEEKGKMAVHDEKVDHPT